MELGECSPGDLCDGFGCRPINAFPLCNAPALIEIPLPDAAQGTTLDLQFADLDGDGFDELLILRPGELLVIRNDQSFASTVVDPLSEELTVLHTNDDAHLDVLLTSSVPDHASLLLGNGDGSLASPSTRSLPGLTQVHPLDWPDGDTNGLVALDFDTRAVVHIVDLTANPPDVQPFPVVQFANEDIDAIHLIWSQGLDKVIVRRGCDFVRHYYGGGSTTLELWGTEQSCASYVEFWSDLDVVPRLVVTAKAGIHTDLRVFNTSLDTFYSDLTGLITGWVTDLARVEGLGMVLVKPTSMRLLNLDLLCVAPLDSLPVATRVVAGNFTWAAGREFALLGPDRVSVWRRL